MQIAVYTRVQSSEGASELKLQQDRCKDFIFRHKAELFGDFQIELKFYTDVLDNDIAYRGISLAKGIKKFIADSKTIDYLVVSGFEVLTNDIRVMQDFLNDLNIHGVALIVAQEGYESVVTDAVKLNKLLKEYNR